MPESRTQIHFLPVDRSALRAFQTGVSLHSHTEHSRERMESMPRYLEQMPVVARLYLREVERFRRDNGGELPDFRKAYWRSPLKARAAYELEQRQIEAMGLAAIVSLTDHDTIDAGLQLNAEDKDSEAPVPVSVEWTAPYKGGSFHLGVHNLPLESAVHLIEEMAELTERPNPRGLRDLLEELDTDRSVLVVLNHPLWDMAGLGSTSWTALVGEFLQVHKGLIHALEINGLRSWQENMGVVHLAQATDHPVVSGGDRHGLEPNAVINLTRAASLAEFVHEIRTEQSSDIAVLPQYGEPLILRHMLTAWDAVREHPALTERKFWINRIFVHCDDGVERPLSALWTEGAPEWIDPCLKVVGVLASKALRVPFRLAYSATGSATL